MQTGTVPRLWFCRRSWRLKFDFKGNFVHIWKSRRNLQRYRPSCKHTNTQIKIPTQHNDLEFCNVDYVSSNVKSSQFGAMLYIFEDNEAVIKMIIKGRNPTMRHISRTHRVSLDWLFDRINFEPKIQIKNVETKKPIRRHTDQGKFHTWWMESSFVFVQHYPCQFYQLFWGDVKKNRKRCRWRTSHSKIAQLKERQKWSHEKPKLDNARKLRGIYFIDPEDKEFKETIKNARKKLETPMAPAMPCKTRQKCKHGETRGKTNEFKSKPACVLEASESTRLRMEDSLPNYHEDRIAGKGDSSLQHYNLVHKIIPHASSNEDTRSKSICVFRMGGRGTWQKSEVNQRWSMKQGRRAQKFILPHWWTSVIWRMPNWRQSTTKSTKVGLFSEVIL